MSVKNAGSAWRVLVVDDHEQIRSALKQVLSFEGYNVMTAGSGARALDLLATAAFDLVLLDVNMPVLDGFGVLARMRDTPELAEMPVIMVTGVVDSASIQRGRQLRVSDYLVKPYRTADLLSRVERCLGVASGDRLEDLVAACEDAPPEGEASTQGSAEA